MNNVRDLRQKNNLLNNAYATVSGLAASAISTVGLVMAETPNIWDKASAMFNDLYGKILGISTMVAVLMAAVALIIRLVSKNQRSVDEATQWLKRIVITWIVLNSLGFIVAYIAPLVDGGTYTP